MAKGVCNKFWEIYNNEVLVFAHIEIKFIKLLKFVHKYMNLACCIGTSQLTFCKQNMNFVIYILQWKYYLRDNGCVWHNCVNVDTPHPPTPQIIIEEIENKF